jgi:hypothetical protein
MGLNTQELLAFLAIWAIAGVGSAFLLLNRNASLKRRLFPPYAIGVAVRTGMMGNRANREEG